MLRAAVQGVSRSGLHDGSVGQVRTDRHEDASEHGATPLSCLEHPYLLQKLDQFHYHRHEAQAERDHNMPLLDLFSYRKRVANGDTPDVYDYDNLPRTLRVQVIHIWGDAIGLDNEQTWKFIHDGVAREHGVLELGGQRTASGRCATYLLENRSVDQTLDMIEASFRYIHHLVRNSNPRVADNAINELNERFRRAGVGYQFEDGKVFRVDSELIHAEVVRPALRYLHEKGFEGPRDEFMQAHGHYRAGQTKDAITDANNAFESMLKTICDQRRWQYPKGARASDLLKVLREKGLLPDYLDNSFDQLAATLRSGLPKVRGEEGAHGQGSKPRETPDYVAAYALHLAAAKILFLADAHKAMK